MDKPFFSPDFFTVQSFFEAASTLSVADRYTQVFVLHECYNSLLIKEGEKEIDIEAFLKFGNSILSDFGEIDRYLVNAFNLFKELEDIAVINEQFSFLTEEQISFLSGFWNAYYEGKDKAQQMGFIKMWRRMPALYKDFHQHLAAKNLSTPDNIYRQVAQNPQQSNTFFNRYKKIFFIGFNAISRAEERVFNYLADAGRAEFYFDVDPFYMDDPVHEAGTFIRKNINAYGLENSYTSSESFLSSDKKVHVYQVEGQVAQAKALAERLPSIIQSESINAGDTAIVLADETLLLPLLQSLPERIGDVELDLNVTMGMPFAKLPLFGLISDWIAIQTHYLKRPETQRNSVPFALVQPVMLNGYTQLSADDAAAITLSCINRQSSFVEIKALQEQNAVLNRFFASPSSTAQIPQQLTGLLQCLAAEESKSGRLKKVDSDVFQHIYSELAAIEAALHLPEISIQPGGLFVLNLIKNALQSLSIPFAGNAATGIQIMGALETRSLDFKNIIFLGFNEGIFPKSNAPQTFIPYNIRKAFGLSVIENQDAISSYIFYRSIQRAENIFLFYNSTTTETITGEPSRFLKQIEFETSYCFQNISIRGRVESFKNQPSVIEKTPAVMEKIDALFSDKGRSLSPSAFLTYLLNPLDFFYRYVASIQQPEEVDFALDMRMLGNLFHDFMQDLYAPFGQKAEPVTSETLAGLRKHLQAELDDKLVPKLNSMPDGQRTIIVSVIKKFATSVLECDVANAPFAIVGLEQPVGPVKFSFTDKTGRKRFVKLAGKIDRIDRLANGQVRIVDYKTGSDTLDYGNVETCFDNSKKINKAFVQTMLYAWMYHLQHGELPLPVLYVLKSLKTSYGFQTHFAKKIERTKTPLDSRTLNDEMKEFLQFFSEILIELSDPDRPFVCGKNQENFKYSPYFELLNA